MLKFVNIFCIFFKIGLFTIGGGLAALPLLQKEVLARGWLTKTQFADIIAISESTPGPIGVNMSTYVGFNKLGVVGSIAATLGLVMPSIIIILIIAKFFKQYRQNRYVTGIFTGLRPAVTGLIAAAAYSIAQITFLNIDMFRSTKSILDLIDIKAIIMFVLFMYITNKYNKHPIFYIISAGLVGLIIF